MGDWVSDKQRRQFSMRIVAVATAVAMVVHFAIWLVPTGSLETIKPDVLLYMVGPALLPTVVASLMVSLSAKFDRWSWILGSACAVFVVEVAAYWLWASGLRNSLGYEFIYLMPVFGGVPLLIICYAVVDAGTRPHGGVSG